jgi:hypothetical protein
MTLPKTRRKALEASAALAAVLAAGILTIFGSPSRSDARVTLADLPEGGWHVTLLPPLQEFEPPALIVSIDHAVRWPGGGDSGIYYRVNILMPHEAVAKDVGRLTSTERFSTVMVSPRLLFWPSSALQREFDDPPSGGGKNSLAAAFADAKVQLVAYDGDTELHQDKPAGPATKPNYTWGQAIASGPNKGKKPEDVANEIIDKQVTAICDAKDAQQKPLFPDECAKLKALRAESPKKPKVLCMLHGAAGSTNPNDGTITLDGDDLLNSEYPSVTILHEISHALDYDSNLLAPIKDWNNSPKPAGLFNALN